MLNGFEFDWETKGDGKVPSRGHQIGSPRLLEHHQVSTARKIPISCITEEPSFKSSTVLPYRIQRNQKHDHAKTDCHDGFLSPGGWC